MTRRLGVLAVPIVTFMATEAAADPCGMVPPIWTGQGPAITRVGEQMTYVFFRDGVETFAIRPGFSGKVDNFGMLIPFPSPPAIRKVPDELFDHIAAAIDPPEVNVDLTPRRPRKYRSRRSAAPSAPMKKSDDGLKYDEVRVLRQEAIGMYEVAVLEAGSPEALAKWMDQNGYQYPKGMDRAVGDYVSLRWAFVAVKTRVGSKGQVSPKPGMRSADAKLPPGSNFDGKVQAMGFRFLVDEPVVPMRLSAFNEGQLRNIVYFLTTDPMRLRGLPTNLIRRQVRGNVLKAHVTQMLPVRIQGGELMDISRQAFDGMDGMRNPDPYNGRARELFAADLYALQKGKLALPFEEREKTLLRISEALMLRGTAIDSLHDQALATERTQTLTGTLGKLRSMVMTVIDGDFPRDYLAEHNLTFSRWSMPKEDNRRAQYDARAKGPSSPRSGVVVSGNTKPPRGHPGDPAKMRWFRTTGTY